MLAGIVTEAISGIGMYLYNQNFKRMNSTSDQLNETWKILTALQQAKVLPESKRDDVMVMLIAKLANANPPARRRPSRKES